MKGCRFFKNLSLQWSLEGPLEGLLDLSQDLIGYRSKISKMTISSLVISLTLVIFLLISLSVQTFHLYIGFTNLLSLSLLIYIFKIFGTIILVAVSTFILILMFQSYRFLEVLFSRFDGLRKLLKGYDAEDEFEDNSSLETRHLDPYRSSTSFTEDVSMELPQLRKQLSHASILFVLAAVFLLIDFALHLTFISSEYGFFLPKYGNFGILWKSIEFVLILFSFLAWSFTANSGKFLEYFDYQSKIIEDIKNDKTPFVPEGKDVLERFKGYLESRDNWLIQSLKKSSNSIDINDSLRGYSGEENNFDLSYISDSNLDYLLLVKIADSRDLDMEYCEKYRKQIKDVIKKLEHDYGERPKYLRAVILTKERTDKLIDLDEELVEYIMSKPIRLREGPGGCPMKTSIQIVIEEGETYSVFPFLPEGKIQRR